VCSCGACLGPRGIDIDTNERDVIRAHFKLQPELVGGLHDGVAGFEGVAEGTDDVERVLVGQEFEDAVAVCVCACV
jgi:hypothetical protein